MENPPPLPSGEVEIKLSRSVIFPLIGGRATWKQEHLPPIFVTLVAGIALFLVPFPWPQFVINGKPAPVEINIAQQVFIILGLYITFMVNYYVNQMCGRAKPRWLIALVVLFTFLMLGTLFWNLWYYFFYSVIPGTALEQSKSVVANLAGSWLGTGLCEEGFKALPLFGLALLGAALLSLSRRTTGRFSHFLIGLRKRVAICEPLDGIVLGVASGSGFFMRETLGQYLPNAMSQQKYPSAQAFDGLVLLLARGLPDLTEHSAWCGLFGYFIGLSVLRPRMAIFLIPLGWLSAAALHGAWDGITSVTSSNLAVAAFLIGDGLLSYALLAGAIFKAREISPRLAAMRSALVVETQEVVFSPLPATAGIAKIAEAYGSDGD
jgi:RsiW-degrading membrane proteinase PrsW (M82 family)